MSKKISVPLSGKTGCVVNVITRYGQVEREYVLPHNPKRPGQTANRGHFGRIVARWRFLAPEQRLAWEIAAADSYTISRMGRQVALKGYNYYIRINSSRADLGLPLFDLPPAIPTFALNQIGQLVIANRSDVISLKLWVPSLPAQYTLVQGAAPCSAGRSCVQHFPFLGFLPAPTDGWSDITALYVAAYGVPTVGSAVWVRTRQHIDGWNDLPKQTSAIVPAA